jgi:quinolinate synthase
MDAVGVDTSATASTCCRRLGRAGPALAAERDAVILAHNYQLPEIQDVAHHTGDSLGLSRIAAEVDASTIVFCGVHFMAETAKILSYDKTVLIPDERAGCSLAETITAEQLRAGRPSTPAPWSSATSTPPRR